MSWKDYYTAITGQKAPSEQASPSGTIYGTTPSRTSAVEDYYNEQMQQKQATEKARDIIDGRGRGHVGGLRDAWLDKHGEAESKTVDSRGHNSALRNEYQRQHPNVPTMSNALTDDEKFQLQSAYADAANKYKDASKKAQSIRPEEGLDYAATLEKYRSEQQAATKEKAAAESEMDRLRKQLEFYKVELPNVDQNVFERLWGSVKGGSNRPQVLSAVCSVTPGASLQAGRAQLTKHSKPAVMRSFRRCTMSARKRKTKRRCRCSRQ